MILAQPLWLALLLLVPLPWLLLRRKGYVGYSDVRLAKQIGASSVLHLIPVILLSLGFVALSIALARPQNVQVTRSETIKARDIIIAVDKSGSMGASFEGTIPEHKTGTSELDKEVPSRPKKVDQDGMEVSKHRRLDAAQAAVLNFIRDRYAANAGDRVGVILFDFVPYYSWPLTHDLKMIYRKIEFADEGLGGGTNFGEYKPGPIDYAADHFDELGQSVTKVLIMVTDGEDRMSDGTMSRLKDILNSRGIKLYVIGVGETMATRDVDILRLAESVGGESFRVENAKDLDECFRKIDSMERSAVQIETSTKREEMFMAFALAAALLLILGVIGEALVLNQ
ncbi:MAG: VWA domain-containing protein [Leptolyngbya sp.]|nr:VWA domain-containing protein [Candidatus Melainabacteria bacterium]